MARARWNDTLLAESNACVVSDGTYYFPPESLNRQYFRATNTRTVCSWKGVAHYFDIVVDGAVNPDAAWYYPYPKPLVNQIKAHVAFWKGVQIEA